MTTPIDMESSGNSLDVAVSGTDEAPQSVGEVTPKSGPSLQASNNATPMRVDVPATEVTDTAAIRSVSKDGSEVALMEDVEDDDVMEQLGNDSDGFPMDDADVCRDSTGHSPISKELERHIQHQQHLDRTQRQHQRNPSSRPLRATAALRRTIRSCSSSTSRRTSPHSSISSGHGEEEQDIVVESWCEEILPETVEAAAVEANLTTSGISNTTTATSAAATPAPITTAAAASAAAPSQTPPASPAVRHRESKKPPLPWRQSASSASTATAAEKSRRGPLSPYAQPHKGPAAATTGRRATTTTAPTRGGATTAGRGGLHKTSSSSLLQTAPAALSGDGADASTASSMGAELATPAAATTGRRGRLNATAPPTTNTAAVPRSTCNPNFASILTNKGRLYTVSQKDIVVDPDQATKTPNELLYMTKRCLLPPLVSKAEQERTVTVVFDLDETLCNNRRVGPALLRPGVIPMFRELRSLCASPKYQVTASDRSASTRLYNQAAAVRQLGIASHGPRMVSRRPPTFSVLRLEIVLWTASMEQVARPVMLRLDPENSIFDQRIYRDVRWYRESNCVKDLRRLGRPLDQIVIVENSTVSVQMNRSNAILMTDFINSKHDRQIYVVRAILTDWIRRCNRSLRLRATELLAEQRLSQQQQQDGLMAGPSPLGSEARVEPSANRPDDFCEELDKTVAASTDRQYDVSDTATMDPDSPLIPASLAAKTANTTALDKMLATPGFITFLEVKKTPDEAPAYGEVSLPAYLAAHPFMSPGTNYIRLSASKEVIRSRRSSSR